MDDRELIEFAFGKDKTLDALEWAEEMCRLKYEDALYDYDRVKERLVEKKMIWAESKAQLEEYRLSCIRTRR